MRSPTWSRARLVRLWLRHGDQSFRPVGALEHVRGRMPWNRRMVRSGRFLERTGLGDRSRRACLGTRALPRPLLPEWLVSLPGAWLVVPLPSPAGLVGFVVLVTARASIKVDWEVLDLLKTAGRQAASYLAQIQVTEALLEARKFDAFNRMSAFVVHDLKNLVAQLSLTAPERGATPQQP